METKEAFHKWSNGGKTLVAYNGGKPKELFRSDSLEEIQRAFRDYYGVKAQVEKGMPWKVAGNHLVVCREAPDGKFEVREYNSFKNRIEMPLERCETLKQAEKALEKYAVIANAMTDFNSLTERQQHCERALREARQPSLRMKPGHRSRHAETGRTMEVGR
jgi:hypothetical protein